MVAAISALTLNSCRPAAEVERKTNLLILENPDVESTSTVGGSEQATPFPTIVSAPAEDGELIESGSSTIILWHALEGERLADLLNWIDAFQTDHPNLHVEPFYVPFDDLQNRFEAASQSGEGPTLLLAPTEWGPAFYEDGLIADLTKRATPNLLSRILPSALESARYHGALVSLPRIFSKGIVLFRNTSIIPDAPTTFDELITSARSIASRNQIGAYLDYSFAFSGGSFVRLGGQLVDAEGVPRFNDATGIEWVNLLKRYEEAGPIGNNTDADLEYFIKGDVGMIIEGTWNTGAIAGAVPEENLAIDPLPEPLSGFVWTESVYLSSAVPAQTAAVGWTFMKFLLSPEVQAELTDPEAPDQIPVLAGLEQSDPLTRQLENALSGGVPFPAIPQMSVYWEPLDTALSAVLEGAVEPADALTRAEEEILGSLLESENP